MPESSVEHECRQGRRCKARIRDTEGTFHGLGVERPGSLCKACEQSAFAAIGQLFADWCALDRAMTQTRGRVNGPKVKGTPTPPIPIPLDVDTLMTAIDDETLRWAVRVNRGEELPSTPRLRVQRCVTILKANTGTLVDLPMRVVTTWLPLPFGGDTAGRTELDGVDAVLRLADLHRQAHNVLGIIEVTTWLPDPCHLCGMRTLTVAVEANTVNCRNCRNVWDHGEFVRLSNPLEVA